MNLSFDKKFETSLPGDSSQDNSPRLTPDILYAKTPPEEPPSPTLLHHSKDLAQDVGLEDLFQNKEEAAQYFSGKKRFSDAGYYATRYGGHQFGHWANQLGDGRAITIGEILNNSHRFELQMKGAGRTPYSRGADGKAVLRSSIREYLCSEAMHALRVPTTRALSLVLTGEDVMRDRLYDGNPAPEKGAIVTRVAESFLRFGHIELLAASNETSLLKDLLRYIQETYFFHWSNKTVEDFVPLWFDHLTLQTMELMVEWLRVGFVHGVMNTDNMSLFGLTIDYGPYGWLDDFNPHWTPNTTDQQGRYAYSAQPSIALWNLQQLASALTTVSVPVEPLQKSLEKAQEHFYDKFLEMRAKKLGGLSLDEDITLLKETDKLLQTHAMDYTLFYSTLSKIMEGSELKESLSHLAYQPKTSLEEDLSHWISSHSQWIQSTELSTEEQTSLMKETNPEFIPRNFIIQEVIDDTEDGALTKLEDSWQCLQSPYQRLQGLEQNYRMRPDWAKNKFGCSKLSCSS